MKLYKNNSTWLQSVTGLEINNSIMICGISFRIRNGDFFSNYKDRKNTTNFIFEKIGLK